MRWAKFLLISFVLSALGYLEFGISFFGWEVHIVATGLLMIIMFMVCSVDNAGYYELADVHDGYQCFLTLTGCKQNSIHRNLDGRSYFLLSISSRTLTDDPPC